MNKADWEAVSRLATLRKETLQYCGNLPQFIKSHGSAALGHVSLTLGKYFTWTGPILDQYTHVQPLPGQSLPRVTDLGEELRVLGLELIENPTEGELAKMIETTERHLSLMKSLRKEARAAR